MFEKRRDRINRISGVEPEMQPAKKVTDLELFKLPGASYEVITVPKPN
jgi:hypothetical protein